MGLPRRTLPAPTAARRPRCPKVIKLGSDFSELGAALGKHGLWSAPMHEAEVFVLQFPGQAGVFMSAASAIRGAYQLSPKVLLSGGGVVLTVKPVFHLAKTLYISPACAAGQAPFCAFVQRAVASTKGCKWNVALASWAAVRAAARPGSLLVLVRSMEVGAAPVRGHRNTVTVKSFVEKISAVDVHNSLSGLC